MVRVPDSGASYLVIECYLFRRRQSMHRGSSVDERPREAVRLDLAFEIRAGLTQFDTLTADGPDPELVVDEMVE